MQRHMADIIPQLTQLLLFTSALFSRNSVKNNSTLCLYICRKGALKASSRRRSYFVRRVGRTLINSITCPQCIFIWSILEIIYTKAMGIPRTKSANLWIGRSSTATNATFSREFRIYLIFCPFAHLKALSNKNL